MELLIKVFLLRIVEMIEPLIISHHYTTMYLHFIFRIGVVRNKRVKSLLFIFRQPIPASHTF